MKGFPLVRAVLMLITGAFSATITLTNADDPTNPVIKGALVADSTRIHVMLKDSLANRNPLVQDSVTVLLHNGPDSVRITLKEVYSENSSWFRSDILSISTTPGWIRTAVSPPQGDTLHATYRNPFVPSDSTSLKTPVWSPWPSPKRSGFYRSCGGAYQAKVVFDRPVPISSLPKQLIANGSFEYPVKDLDVEYYSDSIGAWKVMRKGQSVNMTKRAYALPHGGDQSLDLNGSDSNSIQQTLATTAGQNLTLTFWWNTSNGCGTDAPKAVVLWNGVPIDTLPYAKKPFKPNWNQDSLKVTTKGKDVLTFRSLNEGPCGPYLDDISLLSLTAPVVLGPDTLHLVNAHGEKVSISVAAAATSLDASRTVLTIPLPAGVVPDTTAWSATGRISVPYGPGTFNVVTAPMTDSIGPWITTAKTVENLRANPVDTLVFWTTEPIVVPTRTFFLKALRGGVALNTSAMTVDSAWLADPTAGKWIMAVRNNMLQAGDSVILDPAYVRDAHGIKAATCPTLYRKLSLQTNSPQLVSGAVVKDCGRGGHVTALLDHPLGPLDVAGGEILQNASFESPQASFYGQYYGRTGLFDGWHLKLVDVVTDTDPAIGVPRSDGNQSLDLNGSDPGQVWQVITPPAGSRVRFSVMYMAYGSLLSRAGVSWNGQFLDTLKQDISRNGKWDTARFDLVSTGRDSLCLFGINSGPSGMLVDALSLKLLGMTRSSGTNIKDGSLVLLGPRSDTTYRLALDTTNVEVGMDNMTLRIVLPDSATHGLTGGQLTLKLDMGAGQFVSTAIALTDSVGPWIDSAKIVENKLGHPVDTIAVWLTEPLVAPVNAMFLKALRGGGALSTSKVTVDSAWLADSSQGKWILAVRGGILKAGDSVLLDSAKVKDSHGNHAETCPSLYRKLALLARPITVWPQLVSGAVAKDCGAGGHVSAKFDSKLGLAGIKGGRVVVLGTKNDTIFQDTVETSRISIAADSATLDFVVPDAATDGLANGTLVLSLDPGDGTTKITSALLTDSVGPWIDSARIVENLGGNPVDTISVWLDEPIAAPSRSLWLKALRAHSLVETSTVAVDSAWLVDPITNRWNLAIRQNVLVAGDSLFLDSSLVADAHGNKAAVCPDLHRVLELAQRPPPVGRSWILDGDGDGMADQVVVSFMRKLHAGESPDSVQVRFGPFDSVRTVRVIPQVGDSILRLVLPDPFPRTITVGSDSMGRGSLTAFRNGVSAVAALADSVGPNLLSAKLVYGTDCDTLRLTFTEKVAPAALRSGLVKFDATDSVVGYQGGAVSADSLVWIVPVAPGSVVLGDSIKPAPANGYVDRFDNHPSPFHPWVRVSGLERAPKMAWYSDIDGDGVVDHVTVRWSHGPKTRPDFRLLWPSREGGMDTSKVTGGAWSLGADGRTATIPVGPFAVGVTSSSRIDLGRQISSGTGSDFPIYDSVAAVLTSAKLRYASSDSDPDTLRLTWSEPIRWAGRDPLVRARTRGDTLDVVGQKTTLNPDSLGGQILVDPSRTVQTPLGAGDSLRLSPRSAGTVTDAHGNAAENPTRWVPVQVGHRPLQLKVVLDKGPLRYDNWKIDPGAPIKVFVKSTTDGSWREFASGAVAGEDILRQGTGIEFSINQAVRGGAYLFDHQGVYVAHVDLNPLLEAYDRSLLPLDGRNRYSVRVVWNGTSDEGRMVASGVYALRLLLWTNRATEGEKADWRAFNQVYNLGWHVFTNW